MGFISVYVVGVELKLVPCLGCDWLAGDLGPEVVGAHAHVARVDQAGVGRGHGVRGRHGVGVGVTSSQQDLGVEQYGMSPMHCPIFNIFLTLFLTIFATSANTNPDPDPLCKKSKTFFILVSLEYPDTFLFNKIFGWSKFSRVWVWICVCRRSKNRQKKRPKKRQKSPC